MIKNINHDIFSLQQKAVPATATDIGVADDLLDTLRANRSACVGMAANMIGVNKAIIVFECGFNRYMKMFNPKIIGKSGEYTTEEGCLSLSGTRKTTRYVKIKVRYQDENFAQQVQEFTGRVAQIIQHEIDHTNGVLI